ncbi:MAG: sigma-70 family RNA polymerase sigma factor, partial [Verrucomicrobiae bacterium]|nr:sigma-70 family RNA polymerase sigma factor [Verrucomicrobiae bacterium]
MQETDGNLLKRFANHRDEAAFSTLAGRHLGLIYHTALRRTGNRQLAEEVSQNVLCAVAKKAGSLAKHPDRLPAWLHRATLFESSKVMRSEASHQRRKTLRHPDEIESTGDEAAWSALSPHLDQALDRLSNDERSVVLLHYFHGLSFPRIGEQQSRPAATVQKQCRRAVEKLSRMLRGKGLAITTGALAAGLSTQVAKAAPPMLLHSIVGPVLSGSAAYSTTQLTLFMAMKSKATAVVAALVLLTPLGVQQLAISQTQARNEQLRLAVVTSPGGARVSRPLTEMADASTAARRVTIDQLSRALDDAKRVGG